MNDIDEKRLELAGSMGKPLLWLFALMAVPLAIAMVALMVVRAQSTHAGMVSLPGLVFLAPAIILITAIVVVCLLRRARVYVDQGDLVVNTGLGSERVALASLRAHELEIVNLDERSELKPVLKLWGTGLPGFCAGWFRLRNAEKALCLIFDLHRVCYLRSDARNLSLLLSLQHPETLRALINRSPGG